MATMTQQIETTAPQSRALSKNSAFDFLKGSKQGGECLTPLEREANQIQSFASYTTGTVELKLTPDVLSAVEDLREMTVSTEFKRLAQFVSTLQASFPSQSGLLVAFINPAWLASHVPFCETPQDVTEDMIQRSTWKIDLQGEMALVDGVPVWDRLEGERYDFFLLFKLYRDARYGLIDSGDYVLCSRSMAGLARRLAIKPLLLATLAKIYNWQLRCSYYDLFFENEILRRRQMEVQILQRDHLKFATTLLDKAMTYFERHANQITPKDAIAMAELGFKFSRLSLGLVPDKPIMKGSEGEATSPLLSIQVNNADKMFQVNDQRSYGSEVERRLQENLKDNDNLLSILHVLQKSGAMATALHDGLVPDESINVEDTIEQPAVMEPVHKGAKQASSASYPVSFTPIEPPDIKIPAGFEGGA